jgi:hypothetical protein
VSFQFLRGLISHLISLAMILQGAELLQMLKSPSILKIWSRDNLIKEMRLGLPVPHTWVETLASNSSLPLLAWVEIGIGIVAFIHPSAFAFFILFLAHFLACVRFRGSINGGSDSMTVMILIGMIIAFLFKKESFAGFGLIFISINLLLSYLKAGIAKARIQEWRDGAALPLFLEQSFFADIRGYGKQLASKPALTKYTCWAVIAIELGLVISPLVPSFLPLIFAVVVLFHFAIYYAFGLNRFFWVWIAAWPSVFYAAALIGPRAVN